VRRRRTTQSAAGLMLNKLQGDSFNDSLELPLGFMEIGLSFKVANAWRS